MSFFYKNICLIMYLCLHLAWFVLVHIQIKLLQTDYFHGRIVDLLAALFCDEVRKIFPLWQFFISLHLCENSGQLFLRECRKSANSRFCIYARTKHFSVGFFNFIFSTSFQSPKKWVF